MEETLEKKLGALQASEPIPYDSVDFTIRNPDRLKDELGWTFAYFGRVEGEVAAEPLMTMMPRLGTEYKGYKSHGAEFLEVWVAQEQAHAAIFDGLQRELGLTPLVPNIETSPMHHFAGALGRLSTSLHAVLEMVYLTRGAMHEKLTFIGYERMAEKLKHMGEIALFETIIRPVRRQEAGHLGYYRQAAAIIKTHLNTWQLALARRISIKTYSPVGAGHPDDKAHFGHVAGALVGEDLPQFTDPIQHVAQELLTNDQYTDVPKFVLKALKECV
jgi:hypothetical protein